MRRMSLTPPFARRAVAAIIALLACLSGWTATALASDPVIMAAGDIARGSGSKQKYTSDLILKQQADDRLDGVLALGDLQYENGTYSEFMAAGQYNDTWGRFADKTYPAPGNHEYGTSGAKGYFDYFKSKNVPTGKGEVASLRDGSSVTTDGFYSFDIAGWHFVSLNTSNNCSPVSCKAGSPQERWLRDDLARTTKNCIGAYWHHPYGGSGSMGDLWKALAAAKADIVFDGHVHSYKRFSIRDGIQEFTVGTGGEGSGAVMKLVLHSAGYDFAMVGNESDSGSRACNPKGSSPQPAPSASFTATPDSANGLSVQFTDTSSGGATDWAWTYGDGDGGAGANPTHTYAAGGTYTVKLTASNAFGSSTATKTITVASAPPPPPPPPPSPGVTLVYDAHVSAGSPDKNYGSDKALKVKTSSSSSYRSFLQFTIGDLSGPVSGATLRLKATKGKSSNAADVYLVDDMLRGTSTPWTETTLTWNTMPDLGSTKVGSAGKVDAKKKSGRVDIALDSSAFHANGTFSLALNGPKSDSLSFSSQEGGTRPQLIITTSKKSRRASRVKARIASRSAWARRARRGV
jgi:PKD repeat protein